MFTILSLTFDTDAYWRCDIRLYISVCVLLSTPFTTLGAPPNRLDTNANTAATPSRFGRCRCFLASSASPAVAKPRLLRRRRAAAAPPSLFAAAAPRRARRRASATRPVFAAGLPPYRASRRASAPPLLFAAAAACASPRLRGNHSPPSPVSAAAREVDTREAATREAAVVSDGPPQQPHKRSAPCPSLLLARRDFRTHIQRRACRRRLAASTVTSQPLHRRVRFYRRNRRNYRNRRAQPRTFRTGARVADAYRIYRPPPSPAPTSPPPPPPPKFRS